MPRPGSFDERRARARFETVERDLRRSTQDDVILGDGRRLVLRSPNGHFWQVVVDDAGALSTVDMGVAL